MLSLHTVVPVIYIPPPPPLPLIGPRVIADAIFGHLLNITNSTAQELAELEWQRWCLPAFGKSRVVTDKMFQQLAASLELNRVKKKKNFQAV